MSVGPGHDCLEPTFTEYQSLRVKVSWARFFSPFFPLESRLFLGYVSFRNYMMHMMSYFPTAIGLKRWLNKKRPKCLSNACLSLRLSSVLSASKLGFKAYESFHLSEITVSDLTPTKKHLSSASIFVSQSSFNYVTLKVEKGTHRWWITCRYIIFFLHIHLYHLYAYICLG